MKKKILMFAHDPGGVNAIFSLMKYFSNDKFTLLLYAKGNAIDRFADYGYNAKNIEDEIEGPIIIRNLVKWIQYNGFELVITGTSALDYTEKFLWKACQNLNIDSIAILDQWVNYGIRFSKYSMKQIEQYKKNKQISYVPNKIVVMDNYSKQQIINEGIQEERILVFGQPYFEYLFNYSQKENQKKFLITKNEFKIHNNELVITYISEPIMLSYPKLYLGYDEKTIFDSLKEALEKLVIYKNQKVCLIVKIHPREDSISYNDIVNDFNNDDIRIIIDQDNNIFDIIMVSDLICGMSSMALLEAKILQKPIISIQIGLNKENAFILDYLGIEKSVLNKISLEKKILEKLYCFNDEGNLPFELHGATLLSKYVEELLWQS